MNDYIVYYQGVYTIVTSSINLLRKKFPYAVIRSVEQVNNSLDSDVDMLLYDSSEVPFQEFLTLYYKELVEEG